MTFVRVTRDARGYETTFLLHTPRPGERPRLLYWYRSAPGVRVGRRALDEDAIRTIEEQHPDIEFDWPVLLEEAESVPPEVERRPERPRRRARPQEPAESTARRASAEPSPGAVRSVSAASAEIAQNADIAQAGESVAPRPDAPGNPLLDQLVGREIAARLRGRYAEVALRLSELPDDAARQSWQQRADALDPDRWTTPEQILHGIQHADRLFDELKRELPAAE